MIEYRKGNLLKDENAEALVNPINCVGVMGKGLALQFRRMFPENFNAYVKACKHNEIYPGKMFIFETHRLMPPYYIINFPTKRHWRNRSRIEDIDAGLRDLAYQIRRFKINSISLPALGCGLGGLNWNKVRECINRNLSGLNDVRVIVFEPWE